LKASVVSSSAVPGTNTIHHATRYNELEEASASMPPQLGVGGTIPMPRKDKVASNTMELGICMVV
jgi:hypothetical protein